MFETRSFDRVADGDPPFIYFVKAANTLQFGKVCVVVSKGLNMRAIGAAGTAVL